MLVDKMNHLLRGKDDGGWNSSTSQALSKVCRKRWRSLALAAGSPTPPMRINCASGKLCPTVCVAGFHKLRDWTLQINCCLASPGQRSCEDACTHVSTHVFLKNTFVPRVWTFLSLCIVRQLHDLQTVVRPCRKGLSSCPQTSRATG